jgi:hypothetical protein
MVVRILKESGYVSPPAEEQWTRLMDACPLFSEASCRMMPADAGGPAVDFTNYVLSILISLFVGLVGFVVAYKVFDWLTPGVNFSDQLNADNRAVAIFLAGLFVGLGLLLGNAIK